MSKEAKARININKLLEESGWRFEKDQHGPANIQLEPGVRYAELGDDFEHETHGFIDFLLLDKDGRALVVVEAKRESVDPLAAKEQARTYARNVGARFVILSNGNIHYFWDTKHGNPETISRFPTQESITQYETYTPDPDELASTPIDENYIIASQMPSFASDPAFRDSATRSDYLKKNNLKQLRPYQVEAVKALQSSAKAGNQRFLFEMATGTGKTLISSAVIKLFLQSGNARRVLFLVDRLELEDQAQKAFKQHLGKDYRSAIYKENRESWQNASIVVSTIQTFLAGDRYRKEFSPTDFELVISDEAHRSIGGNSRVVFEYFVGYKLGLTATPKNYLHGADTESVDSQREYERRVLLDTYKTFGCDSGTPTFSYDLLKGAKEGFLIQPTLVDARTEITTGLLSDVGYSVHTTTDEGDSIDGVFTEKHYEKKFFNEATNIAMCTALLDNGLFDPVAAAYGEKLFGKSIVFCVSQKHAARVTNILNQLAMKRWPEQYSGSDFAVQVTSLVQGAQQMTINFSNNNLNGKVSSPPAYDSSKSRIAVTVGMMTTGYDCQDILNLALMRPVFSPSEFVQIKGRGTRRYRFEYLDYETKQTVTEDKNRYKFFDFFAVCEYFEDEYPYDEKIKLPHIKSATLDDDTKANESPAEEEARKAAQGPFDLAMQDDVVSVIETPIGLQGMRIDREGFKRAMDEDVLGNAALLAMWTNGDVADAIEYAKTNIFDKPKHFLNLDKVRQLFRVDRRIGVKEFLQFAFGQKEAFESKDELLESEWSKFLEVNPVDQEHYAPVKSYFKAYIVDHEVQDIIKTKQLAKLNFCSSFGFEEYQQLNGYRDIVPMYVKDYVPLNTFMD